MARGIDRRQKPVWQKARKPFPRPGRRKDTKGKKGSPPKKK